MKTGNHIEVSFNNYKDTFKGLIVSIDNNPVNSDRKYKIKQFDRVKFDYSGRPYKVEDSFIEVEENWFNTELTGRKIKIVK